MINAADGSESVVMPRVRLGIPSEPQVKESSTSVDKHTC